MVEETSNSSSKPTKSKPKPVYLWSVHDVANWLKRHCGEEGGAYADHFRQHEITGRSLLRVNENTLIRLGVEKPELREEIMRQIMKIRLRTDFVEVVDLGRQNNNSIYYE